MSGSPGFEPPLRRSLAGDYLGTGMHGGVIYLLGKVDSGCVGKEVAIFDLDDKDEKELREWRIWREQVF